MSKERINEALLDKLLGVFLERLRKLLMLHFSLHTKNLLFTHKMHSLPRPPSGPSPSLPIPPLSLHRPPRSLLPDFADKSCPARVLYSETHFGHRPRRPAAARPALPWPPSQPVSASLSTSSTAPLRRWTPCTRLQDLLLSPRRDSKSTILVLLQRKNVTC